MTIDELRVLIKEEIDKSLKEELREFRSAYTTREDTGIKEENEKVDDLLMKVDTNITLSSVILSENNKDRIDVFIKETINSGKLEKYGLQPMNRLLFYGDSGCGKTYLGKALSNHLGYSMLYVDIARALSQGNVAMNLSKVFKRANDGGKYIIFLDEADSIAWSRDSKDKESGDIRRATNSLFQLMDQMPKSVIVICATNMLHRLDPAFERRFNMKLEFKRPDTDMVETLLKFIGKEFTIIRDKTDTITEKRMKLSYYELQDIALRMMKQAVLNNTTRIKMSDVYIDIAKTMNVKTVLSKN